MMKKLLLFPLLCMALSIYAQINKNSVENAGGQLPLFNGENKNSPTHSIASSPQTKSVLSNLENAVQGNAQMQSDYLNRPTTSRDLLSLTGNDKMEAQKLLQQLESTLKTATAKKAEEPNSPTPPGTVSQNNASGMLLNKVQGLNQQMMMNHAGNSHNNTTDDRYNPTSAHFNLERNFAQARMKLEKQTQIEMVNYRNELLLRVIREEYYRISNDKTPELGNNPMATTSKLAKYKTLRELLQEQQASAPGNQTSNNTNTAIQKTSNSSELENLKQQLDTKIREEEQRSEMNSRHQMEIEQHRSQDHQNRTTN